MLGNLQDLDTDYAESDPEEAHVLEAEDIVD